MFEASFWLGLAALALASGCVVANAALWVERARGRAGGLELLCLATLAAAQVVGIVAGLGLLGVLSAGTVVGSAVASSAAYAVRLGPRRIRESLAGAISRWRRAAADGVSLPLRSATWPGWLGVAVALLVLGVRALAQPPLVYDDLHYHLSYPADWLRTGRLDTPYFPWGGLTPPYYGLNFELAYFWLLAPLRSDVVAKIGQLPALGLLSVAVGLAARALGAGPRESSLAALLPWASPSLVTQAFFNVNSDLWAATFLLISLVLSLALWKEGSVFLLPTSLAVGLFLGSRSYSPVFASVPFTLLMASLVARRLGERGTGRPAKGRLMVADLAKSSALVFVSGGFWYARNLLMIGNPLQPSVTGVSFALWDEVAGEGAGYSLSEFLWGVRDHGLAVPGVLALSLVAGLALALRERRLDPVQFRERALLLGAPFALFILFYLIPPYMRYGRFLMAVVAATYPSAGLVLSGVWPRLGKLGVGPWPALLASAALAAYPVYASMRHLVPGPETVPSALPIASLLVVAIAGLAVAFVGLPVHRLTRLKTALAVAVAVTAAAALGSLISEMREHGGDIWMSSLDGNIGPGWGWVDRATAAGGATIAYSGSNLPYPLYGSRFLNSVLAVPLDGRPGAIRYGLGWDPRSATAVPERDRWREALANLRVDYLFVSSFMVQPGEFPIEDLWARTDPSRFSLAYSNPGTRIYRVER